MQVVRALLHAGATPDPEDENGLTPLHMAAIGSHLQARPMYPCLFPANCWTSRHRQSWGRCGATS